MKIITVLFICASLQVSGPQTIYNHFLTEKKEVALTFDDGPKKDSTEKILAVLNREKVKATFFVLGESAIKNKETLKKIAVSGHGIGLHSYSHPNFHKLDQKGIEEEITKNQNIIKEVIGYKPRFIRPPYGIITNDFLTVASKMNLTIYTWSDDSFDWKKGNTPEVIVKNVFKNLKPGQIILMHDKSSNSQNSIKALTIIIRRLKKLGYSFKVLSSH